MSPISQSPTRAFVLGLDGVPWILIKRWVNDGELPNFARVIKEGASGPLESTTPATTPLAWPSIATGTWPDKHGVYGFQRLSETYDSRIYTSEDIQQPELWDILTPALVGNVPMTFPAAEVDGKMVTGMSTPSPNSSRFTHPPELGTEVLNQIPDYTIGLNWGEFVDRPEEFRADLAGLVNTRRKLMQLFMETEDWRLFFFVYTAPDRLQHLIWDESVLLEHYKQLDEILGEVMEYVARHDALLFVVSDHGFEPISKFVYVNRILEEAGYLVRHQNSGTRQILDKMGISKKTVRSILGRLGVSEKAIVAHLPENMIRSVAAQVPGGHTLYDVDHSQTKAFVFGTGTVYINDTRRFRDGVVKPGDVAAIKREVDTLFSTIVDPETGDPALIVFDGDEVFKADEFGPDLVVTGREGYQKATSLSDHVFAPTKGRMAGSHHPEGIILTWGSGIKPGAMPVDATVVDVAPTLLHCLGEPVGESMDGRVLTEIFHPDSAASSRQVQFNDYGRSMAVSTTIDEDYTSVEERLRGLGYLE